MKILALETTERTGSVAVADGGNVLLEMELSHSQRSAQSLAPAMRDLLSQVGWRPDDVQLTAVSQGPGSFTGLRIGIATAKLFAYATGGELLGIDTLAVIADGSPDEVAELSVVQDAQRGELVVRRFARRSDGWFEPREPERLLDGESWLSQLTPDQVISGPGLVRWVGRLPSQVRTLPSSCWTPRASEVARRAAYEYDRGRRDDLWRLGPRYSRRSAAEEKWDKKAGC
ncbi:MAG: tRNA (adenosine(37)-N6)-threonylcarbamoyltransferase complex dimerization subunit type 1 TsaB [Thermoguttaceae bacterium]